MSVRFARYWSRRLIMKVAEIVSSFFQSYIVSQIIGIKLVITESTIMSKFMTFYRKLIEQVSTYEEDRLKVLLKRIFSIQWILNIVMNVIETLSYVSQFWMGYLKDESVNSRDEQRFKIRVTRILSINNLIRIIMNVIESLSYTSQFWIGNLKNELINIKDQQIFRVIIKRIMSISESIRDFINVVENLIYNSTFWFGRIMNENTIVSDSQILFKIIANKTLSVLDDFGVIFAVTVEDTLTFTKNILSNIMFVESIAITETSNLINGIVSKSFTLLDELNAGIYVTTEDTIEYTRLGIIKLLSIEQLVITETSNIFIGLLNKAFTITDDFGAMIEYSIDETISYTRSYIGSLVLFVESITITDLSNLFTGIITKAFSISDDIGVLLAVSVDETISFVGSAYSRMFSEETITITDIENLFKGIISKAYSLSDDFSTLISYSLDETLSYTSITKLYSLFIESIDISETSNLFKGNISKPITITDYLESVVIGLYTDTLAYVSSIKSKLLFNESISVTESSRKVVGLKTKSMSLSDSYDCNRFCCLVAAVCGTGNTCGGYNSCNSCHTSCVTLCDVSCDTCNACNGCMVCNGGCDINCYSSGDTLCTTGNVCAVQHACLNCHTSCYGSCYTCNVSCFTCQKCVGGCQNCNSCQNSCYSCQAY